MKAAVFFRKHRIKIAVIITSLMLCFAGIVLASSVDDAVKEGHVSAAEHAPAGEHAPATKGWVKTDTARVMNFTVLAVILFMVLRKPVANMLNSRIQGIQAQLAELEAKKREAEQALVKYDEQIAALEKEAEQIVAEYIRQGEEAKKRILEESHKAAGKLEEQARRSIANEFERAKRQLQDEILAKALAKAEALVKEKITSEDQDRLVDEYLNKVVAQ